MIIKNIYKIIAIQLVFLILFSSTVFAIDFHFCNGVFKSLSMSGEAESCHTIKVHCPHHEKMMLKKGQVQDCCKNVVIENLDFDDDKIFLGTWELHNVEYNIVIAFIHVFLFEDIVINNNYTSSFTESPPIVTRDIYALLERYII